METVESGLFTAFREWTVSSTRDIAILGHSAGLQLEQSSVAATADVPAATRTSFKEKPSR